MTGPTCRRCAQPIPASRAESSAKHAARRYCDKACAGGPRQQHPDRDTPPDFTGAPCRDAPRLFWPLPHYTSDGEDRPETSGEREVRERMAVAVCRSGCPHRAACLAVAASEDGGSAGGVYGGLTSATLARYLKRVERAAEAVA